MIYVPHRRLVGEHCGKLLLHYRREQMRERVTPYPLLFSALLMSYYPPQKNNCDEVQQPTFYGYNLFTRLVINLFIFS